MLPFIKPLLALLYRPPIPPALEHMCMSMVTPLDDWGDRPKSKAGKVGWIRLIDSRRALEIVLYCFPRHCPDILAGEGNEVWGDVELMICDPGSLTSSRRPTWFERRRYRAMIHAAALRRSFAIRHMDFVALEVELQIPNAMPGRADTSGVARRADGVSFAAQTRIVSERVTTLEPSSSIFTSFTTGTITAMNMTTSAPQPLRITSYSGIPRFLLAEITGRFHRLEWDYSADRNSYSVDVDGLAFELDGDAYIELREAVARANPLTATPKVARLIRTRTNPKNE